MAKHTTDEDLELLEELGVDTAPAAAGGRTAREQRIIAGFEEIERFVAEHGRVPGHGEHLDIFERLYAVRLDRLRQLPECREVLKDLDPRGLLGDGANVEAGEPDDAGLLAALGVEDSAGDDVTKLVHVRSRAAIKAAEGIARREACKDFDQFKPLFERVQRELESGQRATTNWVDNIEIRKGDLFILEGQKLVIVEVGEKFTSEYNRTNRKLRVVYDNGTESEPLLRSLMRALYEDKASRRIGEPGERNLFSEEAEEGDLPSGTIYVLRSKSDHPFVAEHRTVLHKIGVTGGDVKARVANARKDPTYLLADVEVVATYKLANVNRKALERLLHRFFGNARLDLSFKDRFGADVEPREWFLVPLEAIDAAIGKIKDGSIGGFRYDPAKAGLAQA